MKFTLVALVAGLLATPGTGQIDKTVTCKELLDAGYEKSTVECVANAARPMDCFPPQLILASHAQWARDCNENNLSKVIHQQPISGSHPKRTHEYRQKGNQLLNEFGQLVGFKY